MDYISLDVLLALAAVFIGLSLAVEVLQDIYKYLTISKARAYRIALRDFLGSWVDKAYEDVGLPNAMLRGPFQWFKRQPPARLLPMEKKDLLSALERTAAGPVCDTARVLREEVELQCGTPAPPSFGLQRHIEELWKQYDSDPYARKLFDFLDSDEVARKPSRASMASEGKEPTDARAVLSDFYHVFLPKRVKVDEEFGLFSTHFEHAYRRRNLRQTLVLAFVLAVGLNLAFDTLYRNVSALSPDEVIRLADSVMAMDSEAPEPARHTLEALQERLQDIARRLTVEEPTRISLTGGWERLERLGSQREAWPSLLGLLSYLVSCFVTAVLVSFGAPFWHRLSRALLDVRRAGGGSSAEDTGGKAG